MHRSLGVLVLLGTTALAALPNGASARGLGAAAEVEHARANARAGGPVSEQDAELLERYGCTSGTDNPVCHQGYRSGFRYAKQRSYHRRAHKHRRSHH
jgi:hypothetical protein